MQKEAQPMSPTMSSDTIEAEAEATRILLESKENTLEALRAERAALKQRAETLQELCDTQAALIGNLEEAADACDAIATELTSVFDRADVRPEELQLLAKLRFNAEPETALKAFPPQLVQLLSELDPKYPDLVSIVLGRLRVGSVRLLETYGIAQFSEPNQEGVRQVTINDKLWRLIRLIKSQQAVENTPRLTRDEMRARVATMASELDQDKTRLD